MSFTDAERLDDMERTKCYPFWNGSGWTYIVTAGDYIIRGVKGEFYACKPDIFWRTYERV